MFQINPVSAKRCFLSSTLSLLLVMNASAASRVALVVGVGTYQELSSDRQLTSPANDARDVGAALQALGYSLVTGAAVLEPNRESFMSAARAFATEARGADAAVFYYSGHGAQIGDDNYLLPSDTPKLSGITGLSDKAILLRSSVMVALEEARVKTKVIILDCCRDNPFSAQLQVAMSSVGKSIKTKSLGEVTDITGYGPGFYLAFATSPGSTAADGNGERNSPFTAAMLKALPQSAGKDIDFFFRDVKALLPRDQVSWTNHSISESFALAAAGQSPVMPAPAMTTPPAVDGVPIVRLQEMPVVPVRLAEQPVTPVRLAEPSVTTARLDQPPVTLPSSGFFALEELFSDSPYASYDLRQLKEILNSAQTRLKENGFYSGEPDGVPGRLTQQAIIAWQKSHSTSIASGRLDAGTLGQMNLLGVAKRSFDSPPVSQTPRATPARSPSATRPSSGGSGSREMSVEEFERRARALQRR
ncbi:MAG: caspase family protein [Verrucomicrobiaceae bacterium]|nr:caspase family protein [Verrucomicrobiaceae bacterium]